MIKSQKYFLIKDRKVGFEVKVWTKGDVTVVYECKTQSYIRRRCRTFSKKECIHMPEWLLLNIITNDIKGMKSFACSPFNA